MILRSTDLFQRLWLSLCGLLLAGCGHYYSIKPEQPRVKQGEIDLLNWDFPRKGPVWLKGDWHYYPGYLAPEDVKPELLATLGTLRVPGIALRGEPPPPQDAQSGLRYVTYIAKVRGIARQENLAIWPEFVWSGGSLGMLLIDALGRTYPIISPQGPPPYDFRTRILGYGGESIFTIPDQMTSEEFYLVAYSVSATASFNGVSMGTPVALFGHSSLKSAERYGLLGGFLLLGFLCLGLYAQRREESLYVLGAGVCLSLALRFVGTESFMVRWAEAAQLSPEVRYLWSSLSSMILTVTQGSSLVFLLAFVRRVTPYNSWKRVFLSLQWLCLILTTVLFLHVLYVVIRGSFDSLFVELNSALWVLLAILDLLTILGIIAISCRLRSWSLYLATGASAHLGGFLWDFGVAFNSADLPFLMHYGNLIFCLSLVLMIGRRFALTYEHNAKLLVEIQEKERARTLFFHNTSHELRTPLNGILGFLDLVNQGRYGVVPDAAIRQLEKTRRLAEGLKTQVNTILDLAKSRKGELQVAPRNFSLKELKADVDNLAEGLCLKSPDFSFRSTLKGQILDFCGDREKIFTVLRNLIGNAFKFYDPQRLNAVTLEIHVDAEGLSLLVRDKGIGIPTSALEKIFEEFTQLEGDSRRTYEGTGLGLAMVRALLEAMKGTISVQSELGVGSCFIVRIPHGSSDALDTNLRDEDLALDSQPLGDLAPKVAQDESNYGYGWKLMVVDDHPANAEVIASILAADHYTCQIHLGGQEALDAMRKEPPHLLLLDLMMPGLSGEDVLTAMKADALLKTIPVIVVTARASEEDKIQALKIGADDYLAKPIYAPELRVRVRNVIERLRLHRQALEAEQMSSREQGRLLAIKNQFLANTSHELRTPINGLLGLAEHLLQIPYLREEERETVRSMLDASRRLARTVDSVLDFSAVDQGRVTLELESLDLLQCLEDALRALDVRDKRAGVNLQIELGTDPIWIQGDRRAMTQALAALLSNAFRFTDAGAVRLSFYEDSQHINLYIHDSGCGMSEDQLQSIGQVFEQGDGSITRAHGGTGIGLALVDRLLKLQGIGLKLESALGKGTRVTLRLRRGETRNESVAAEQSQSPAVEKTSVTVAQSESQVTSASSEANVLSIQRMKTKLLEQINLSRPALAVGADNITVAGRLVSKANRAPMILVVDDEPINRRVIINHLIAADYDFVEASSGSEALELYAREGPFDAVLLDVMMPHMSGYECARYLRELKGASELPIIMVTAKQQAEDVLAGFEAGANDYIHKPFSKAELMARLASHLHLGQTARAMRRFVPADMIRLLGCEHLADLTLGLAAQHTFTIVFTDIIGFTKAIEGMTPAQAFEWLNRCYQLMGPEIRKAGGFIDKYIGDAVMALFPESPDAALAAAVAMQLSTRQLQDVHFGTGIHYGQAMLGTLGEEERFDATVLSDAVNVASRIEGASKIFGLAILVSEDFRQALANPGRWHWRPIGVVRLKGRHTTVVLWEVLDADPERLELKLSYLQTFEQALRLYSEGRWDQALELWTRLSDAYPDDRVLAFYQEHSAQHMELASPGPGILELREKS